MAARNYLKLFQKGSGRFSREESSTGHQFVQLQERLARMGNSPRRHRVLYKGLSRLMKRPGAEFCLRNCEVLLELVVTSGLDMMALRRKEFCYLGAFVELKIDEQWKLAGFYALVYSALKRITDRIKLFSEEMEKKIAYRLSLKSPESHSLFLESLSLSNLT